MIFPVSKMIIEAIPTLKFGLCIPRIIAPGRFKEETKNYMKPRNVGNSFFNMQLVSETSLRVSPAYNA
jgi:hypothetical protein